MESGGMQNIDESYNEAIHKSGGKLDSVLKLIVNDEDRKRILEAGKRALKGEKVSPLIVSVNEGSKETEWRAGIRTMESANGIVGISIIMVEVTDLLDAVEKAKDADKAKSNFLANMSHEIRTPMNAITGMSEFIIRDSKDEAAVKNAKMIKAASKSLLSIINDILDFSKIESGKLEIIKNKFYPASLLNDIITMMLVKLQDSNVELKLDIDPDIPALLNGDEDRIKQILINLLGNAVKFTKKGFIKLKVTFEEETDDRGFLIMSVFDTGIGIKEEDISKIFDDFTRVDTRRNRNEEGTGLGLAIAKNLAELMGGDLTVKSTYGKGSTFTVKVEVDVLDSEPMGELTNREKEREEEAYRPAITAKGASILVVDDNEMNLEVTEGILEPYGMEIVCVSSGREAIEKFKNQKFDLIFMDHMMPVMDGEEAMRHIRNLPGGKDAVIIVLTANAISGVGEEYKKMGFQEFLSKPIYPKNMDAIMREFLPPDKIQIQ
jgi:signal transduction histidine kinase/ActR/RegA family two-component response regulator